MHKATNDKTYVIRQTKKKQHIQSSGDKVIVSTTALYIYCRQHHNGIKQVVNVLNILNFIGNYYPEISS